MIRTDFPFCLTQIIAGRIRSLLWGLLEIPTSMTLSNRMSYVKKKCCPLAWNWKLKFKNYIKIMFQKLGHGQWFVFPQFCCQTRSKSQSTAAVFSTWWQQLFLQWQFLTVSVRHLIGPFCWLLLAFLHGAWPSFFAAAVCWQACVVAANANQRGKQLEQFAKHVLHVRLFHPGKGKPKWTRHFMMGQILTNQLAKQRGKQLQQLAKHLDQLAKHLEQVT